MLLSDTLSAVGAANRVKTLARSVTSRLLDLCYPTSCAACEASCDMGMSLCGDCESKLAILEQAAACPRCAMPLATRGDPCPWCGGKGLYPFQNIVRLGVFDDPLKGLIHRAKYHDRWPHAETLADRLFQHSRTR